MLLPYVVNRKATKEDKRIQIETSMMIHIVSVTTENIKRPQMTSKGLKKFNSICPF